jgi:hypothetical protein
MAMTSTKKTRNRVDKQVPVLAFETRHGRWRHQTVQETKERTSSAGIRAKLKNLETFRICLEILF